MSPLKLTLTVAALIAPLAATPALAHAPVFDCHKEDASVVCEAGFSDGSSAAGRQVRVLDINNRVLLEGLVDKDGAFTFKAPDGAYHVVFNGGDNHIATLDSVDIS